MKVLVGCCLALASAWVGAADPDRIEQPAVGVGMSWTLQLSDILTKAVSGETNYRVEAITDREIHIADDSGQVVGRLDAQTLAVLQGAGYQFDPPYVPVRYPLEVGAAWETRYGANHPQCGGTRFRQALKVVGWENVTVPAGTYRALRIDGQGSWSNSCGTDRMAQKHWFVEGLPVPVRSEELIYARGQVYTSNRRELASFNKP